MEIPDCPTSSLLPYLPEVMQFIDAGRAAGGILLHCDSGISRSAAVTIAYVMRDQNMSYDQAFQHVADRRCCVHPNPGFMHQLGKYEFIAQSLGHTPQAQDETVAGRKRVLDDEPMLDDQVSGLNDVKVLRLQLMACAWNSAPMRQPPLG